MSTLILVAALLWAVPTYTAWLWLLHQVRPTDDHWMKWGLIVGGALFAAVWFIWWPFTLKKKRPVVWDTVVALVPKDTV